MSPDWLISALEKASIKDSASPSSPGSLPLHFPSPPPAGTGTRSLCTRCLTVLSHFITHFGNGTWYDELSTAHSSMSEVSSASGRTSKLEAQEMGISENENLGVFQACVICTKALRLFDAQRERPDFEAHLRNKPYHEWMLVWKTNAVPQGAFSKGSPRNRVDLEATHQAMRESNNRGFVTISKYIRTPWIRNLTHIQVISSYTRTQPAILYKMQTTPKQMITW